MHLHIYARHDMNKPFDIYGTNSKHADPFFAGSWFYIVDRAEINLAKP